MTEAELVISRSRPRREPLGDAGLRLWAPAKINLNLLVGPRGENGYHGLDSLASKVTLYDRIDLRAREDGRIALHCTGADCGRDDRNLAVLAAAALARGRSVGGAEIALRKHVPPGRGLGGGSADAAAVLGGLNELWQLALGPEQLAALAAELGSDVSLFLGPPAARMTGRGERLAPIEVHPFVAVMVLPPFACATADVYRAFDARPQAMGRQLDLRAVASQAPSQWRGLLENQLAPAARDVCPALGSLWDRLAAAADLPVHLTGSGSGLFMLCDDEAEATRVVSRLPDDIRARAVAVRPNAW